MRRIITAVIPLILTVLCLGYAGYIYFSGNDVEGASDLKADVVSVGSNLGGDLVLGKGDLSDAKPVTVLALGGPGGSQEINNEEGAFYVDALGVVEAEEQSEIYGAAGSMVKNVVAREGQRVNKGEVIMELGGANGTTHQYENQYRIALQSYESAKKAYENTVIAMNASVRSAELQLDSATKQSEAAYIDYLNVVDGVGRAQRGISLSEDTLYESRMQNREKRNDLVDAIYDLEDQMYDLDYGPERDALEAEVDKLESQLDALDNAFVLAENQIMGQVEQSYAQYDSARTASESMLLKLGYENGEFDSVKMAEQALKSVIAQKNSALTQAEAQVEMARINFESARELKEMLVVRAPFDGIVGSINYVDGQTVSAQQPVAIVFGNGGFVLKAGIDIESSRQIAVGSRALVTVAGRELRLPVLSVAGSADPRTRLVEVRIKVGKLPLTPNQTLNVKLPLNFEGSLGGGSGGISGGGTFYVPLDAVIVATEEKFVYIVDSFDSEKGVGTAKRVIVETGEIRGDVIEVVKGLKGDEKIIVAGARDVKDGEKVVVEPARDVTDAEK